MIRNTKSMKLALALLVGVSAGTFAIATPASAQEMDNFQRYASSGYTYCDAKLMGAIYGRDAYQGKLLIGQKIANGIGSNIPLMLRNSRSYGNSCEWSDTGLSYEDAQALSQYWGVSTPQAKVKAAAFYTGGNAGVVSDALRYGDFSPQDETQKNFLAYDRSGFGYCDAKMIGAYFEEGAYEGKIFIGDKIRRGLIDNIPWYLDRAREGGAECEWSDTPYDYDDAERLAGMWNKSVADTKVAVAKLVTLGRSDVVDTSLGGERRRSAGFAEE